MVAEPQFPQKMSGEEYLEWEAKQEFRHEYIDGEILAMTGSTIPHNDIALNFYRALFPHLRQRGCRVNVSDVKVQARKNSRYFYPDLVVSCNSQDLQSRQFVQFPQVIVEVLSPSTASYDRGNKLRYYRQITSLQEYVLVDSQQVWVEVYQRAEGEMWYYYGYGAGDLIRLASIEFECGIDWLYEGIVFEDESDGLMESEGQ